MHSGKQKHQRSALIAAPLDSDTKAGATALSRLLLRTRYNPLGVILILIINANILNIEESCNNMFEKLHSTYPMGQKSAARMVDLCPRIWL